MWYKQNSFKPLTEIRTKHSSYFNFQPMCTSRSHHNAPSGPLHFKETGASPKCQYIYCCWSKFVRRPFALSVFPICEPVNQIKGRKERSRLSIHLSSCLNSKNRNITDISCYCRYKNVFLIGEYGFAEQMSNCEMLCWSLANCGYTSFCTEDNIERFVLFW